MVSSEFGVGAFEGWISGGLRLLDTAKRGEVSTVRNMRFLKALFPIAEWESKRREVLPVSMCFLALAAQQSVFLHLKQESVTNLCWELFLLFAIASDSEKEVLGNAGVVLS